MSDETKTPDAAAETLSAADRERQRRTVTIKLPIFEGPLDLLLHLIKRDEVDIYDIPIAHITQQYLAYLELMRAFDLEVAGEFLVMAATLMRIKAKMLLPLPAVGEEEDEGDPREELVQRLAQQGQRERLVRGEQQRFNRRQEIRRCHGTEFLREDGRECGCRRTPRAAPPSPARA